MVHLTGYNFSIIMVSGSCSLVHVCVRLTDDEVCVSELEYQIKTDPGGNMKVTCGLITVDKGKVIRSL